MRIDTHHHLIPPDYRKVLRKRGFDAAGGRALPDWNPEASWATMADLDIATTFLPVAADAAALARDLNDYTAGLVAADPGRF